MADSTKSVGKLIYGRRTELGITQKEVADFVGVSEATVSAEKTIVSCTDTEYCSSPMHEARARSIFIKKRMGSLFKIKNFYF